MGFKIAQNQPVDYHHDNQSNSINDHENGNNKHFSILKEAVISLRLGALVVHFNADQDVSSQIKKRLQNSIKRHSGFSANEQTRLQNYLLGRLQALEAMQEVKIELESLALSKKRRVRHILLSIAFADQTYTKQQRHALEQLYLALGLNKRLLKDDIATFSMTQTVAPHNTHHDQISIPAHQSNLKLRAVKQATTSTPLVTQQADHALSATFVEDKTQTTEPSTASPLSERVTATYGQQSLSDKRERLYQHLIRQEQWTQQAFKRLCQQHKLVPNGAIEIINNWAMQHVNRMVLLQQGNVVLMDRGVVAKIQQCMETTTSQW